MEQFNYKLQPIKTKTPENLPDISKQISSGNKKVLIYSPIPLFPAIQGARIRIAMLARTLKARGYELYLVLFGSDWVNANRFNTDEADKQYKELFAEIFRLPQLENHSKYMGMNIDIDDAYEEHLGREVKKIMDDKGIDIILLHYIFQSKILDYLPDSTVKIIDTIDKFTDKYKISNWYSYNAENESKGISRADIVISIQDNEKKYFESITNKKVITIGHLTDKVTLDKRYKNLHAIGLISSGHINDLMAVEKFVKLFIKSEIPNLKLKICGMVCDTLHAKYKHHAIEYLFLVDDLKEFYSAIDLCVIPPEEGTGLKTKSVEALAFGVPVASTKHGFEGIKSDSKFHHAKDIDELFGFIQEIKSNPRILVRLEKESNDFYNDYNSIIEKNLTSIFGLGRKMNFLDRLLNTTYDLCSTIAKKFNKDRS